MENENVKVLNITPIGNTTPNVQQTIQETTQAMNNVLDELSETPSVSVSVKEAKATKFLNNFKDYIQSQAFKDDVEEASKKYGVPPKKLAQNFFEKALGTVGDILGIAINVVCNAGHLIVNIASTICHSIVNLIKSIASGIASIVTLNKTCVAH